VLIKAVLAASFNFHLKSENDWKRQKTKGAYNPCKLCLE